MKISCQEKAVYHSEAIQAWEKRWFALNNSSYGLMQQAALAISIHIEKIILTKKLNQSKILVWCGSGNNAGDGYLTALYLKQAGFNITIYATKPPSTIDAKQAQQEAIIHQINIYNQLDSQSFDVHIDGLYGIGLNRELDSETQNIIDQFNQASGLKIAIDIPSGLHPNTGIPLPIAVQANYTLSVMGLKLGTLIGKAQEYVGELLEIPLIPKDQMLNASAYITYQMPILPSRKATQHKGNFGHVLVIGGHPTMGGAVIMSGESAIACGAGKVTVMCDMKHHTAILSRSPNIMVKDIDAEIHNDLLENLNHFDVVCFGMGLGRDAWAKTHFEKIMYALQQQSHLSAVVLDADALWFLSNFRASITLKDSWIATPHSAEAARLLNCSVSEVENDRIAAIQKLSALYGGQWVLKGAGSLSLENNRLNICAFGNAGMGTAGMGDVLSGMMAGLKAQFNQEISIADIVALHAIAGDELAKNGMRGIQAQHMVNVLAPLINKS